MKYANMELDIAIGIARATGNLTFASTETESVLVLLAHLPGVKKDEIEISINEEGTEIGISCGGGRSSLQAVTSRRLTITREVEIGRSRNAFRIPRGVILDRIDAGFDEEAAILVVIMPKLMRADGSRTGIEEIQGEGETSIKDDDQEITAEQNGEETLKPENLDGGEASEVEQTGDLEPECIEETEGVEETEAAETPDPHQEPKQQEQDTAQKTESPELDQNDPHQSEEQEEQEHEIPAGIPNSDQEQLHQPETPDPHQGPEQQETQCKAPFVEIPDRTPETTQSTEPHEPDHTLRQTDEQEVIAAETTDWDPETMEKTPDPHQGPEQQESQYKAPFVEIADRTPETTQSTEPQERDQTLRQSEEQEVIAAEATDWYPETMEKTHDPHQGPEQQETQYKAPFIEIPDRAPETTQSTEPHERDQTLRQSEEQEVIAAETTDRDPETMETAHEEEFDLHKTERQEVEKPKTPALESPDLDPQATQSTESRGRDQNRHESDEEEATEHEYPDETRNPETLGEDSDDGFGGRGGAQKAKGSGGEDRPRAKRRGREGPSPLHPSSILAGSAFILSLMVLVLHLIRKRRRST